MSRGIIVALGLLLARGISATAEAVTIAGGGSKKNDCLVELQANGLGFPGGAAVFMGTTCADGDVCDADGLRNGSCLYTTTVCLNAADPALPKCNAPAQISAITFKGKLGKSAFDTSALTAAVAALGLPSSASVCSPPAGFAVPVGGPDKKGELVRGTVKINAKAKTTKGTDKDKYQFVCLPSVGPGTIVPTTSTTIAGASTTTTLPAGTPGVGLVSTITGATISASGQVVITFTLTDAAGVALVPRTSSTENPNEARVRFTLARLEVDAEPVEGVSTPFTHYVNYITSGGQPAYDTTGTFALVDAASGTWTYTFGTTLSAGLQRNLTHTVGAQIGRTVGPIDYVANPTGDFVPDGTPVTTVREVTTTAQCNACHDPLAFHGNGRREVKLCQLCHTNQLIESGSGSELDFKHLVHRIHRGQDLPSVAGGPVGASFLGFAEKVNTCASGSFESSACESDADCGGSPCTGTGTIGVAFPQEIRNCTKCHAAGATAADHLARPSAFACSGCHDNVNPGETPLNGLSPGAGHAAGPQPDAMCRLCHGATQGQEFDITVPGAHVNPFRSASLPGLQGEILSASGSAGTAVTLTFRLRDGAGNAITSFDGFDTVRFQIAGPTSDFRDPLITATVVGGGASGTLGDPDPNGVFTYTTAAALPGNAEKSWRVGLEARRDVTIGGGQTVDEVVQNPVRDFSVDGSAVVARRAVVVQENCANCHGTFSKDFSVHGNIRNRVEHCVICHNPTNTDFERRKNAIAGGADPATASINFKQLIHKIHRGDDLERQPYIVYGFGSAPKNYTAHDFSELRFPGDLRDCETCHVAGTQTVPLPAGVLPTNESVVNGAVEQVVGSIPPVTDACTACHDTDAAAAHAETNTTASGAEACAVCHGEGSLEAVTIVHVQDP